MVGIAAGEGMTPSFFRATGATPVATGLSDQIDPGQGLMAKSTASAGVAA
jgi:hypothetical protein